MSGAASVIPHELFKSARKELLDALAEATPGKIIWVIGPSGVGKSELRYFVMRTIAGNPSAWGRGHLPTVALRATLTDRNKFNPKDFALRLALSIRSPDLSWISPREAVESPDESPRVLRRLQHLRRWSHEKVNEVFPRSPRARCAHGARTPW